MELQERKPYPTDLTDAQWEILEPLVPAPEPVLLPAKYSRREIVNAIFYVNRTGCQWRMLPHDFPPWESVYSYFYQWRKDGTWQKINDALRRQARKRAGRNPEPTAAIIDSQSAKTTEMGGPRGYDAGKKVKGRKRHLLVDVLGFVLAVLVLPANIQDREGGWMLLVAMHSAYPSITKVWADGAYAGELVQRAHDELNIDVEIVKTPPGTHTFQVLPRRWIVERTFGWWNRERRLSKDYERLPSTTEAWVDVTMIRLMTRRLSHPTGEPAAEPTHPPLLALPPANPPLLALPPANPPLLALPPAQCDGHHRANVWADSADEGELVRRACDELNVDVVKTPPGAHNTFHLLALRCIMERTFGGWNRDRRLSKDYERLPSTTEAMVQVATVRRKARRRAHPMVQLAGATATEPAGPPLLALPPGGFDSNTRPFAAKQALRSANRILDEPPTTFFS